MGDESSLNCKYLCQSVWGGFWDFGVVSFHSAEREKPRMADGGRIGKEIGMKVAEYGFWSISEKAGLLVGFFFDPHPG